MSNTSWRQVFTELCEAIFRELGFDPPPMLHEHNLPLAMELEVDQRSFELVHSSSDHPERVLVICRLGPLPDDVSKIHYAALLSKNLRNARDYLPCFGVNADCDEVIWMSFEFLEKMRASLMLEKLRLLAHEASYWQDGVFNKQYGFEELSAEMSGVPLA